MKKIVFLTGTRADFGKLKSLIQIITYDELFEVFIFATGMHMNAKYGRTIDEISKCGFKNIFPYFNHSDGDSMEQVVSNTIQGFSKYVNDIEPDLIVLHGDRPEVLAGAIVGSFNNIHTAHIEGGEVSGTIDESIRHAVSKLCHIHLVSNENAKNRLIQMGEISNSIYIIGSPDIDILLSNKLPSIVVAKERYIIPFENYSILMFHPVTTEYDLMSEYVKRLVDAIIESNKNFIVVFPNNDKGSEFIFQEYKRFENNKRIKVFPSIRFEYFLTLLKNSKFIIGNSSAGIIEAPYYKIPTINIGTRQNNRSSNHQILNCTYNKENILKSIEIAETMILSEINSDIYGCGKSSSLFHDVLTNPDFWKIDKQKTFKDLH